jgi:hypothetical protein
MSRMYNLYHRGGKVSFYSGFGQQWFHSYPFLREGARVISRGNCMAVVAAAGLVFLSTPAFAWNQVRYGQDVRVIASGVKVEIHDLDCDGEAVKGKWKLDNKDTAKMYSKRNGGGYNTVSTVNAGSVVHGIQACLILDFRPDKCSAWKYWD